MIQADVIIVGGGPAGSACAWKLIQNGIDCLILDKKEFPRPKVCAGWITPRVLRLLEIIVTDYPHGLITFDRIFFHLYGVRIKVKTVQYSIRRHEFDHWLLKRSQARLINHRVRNIAKEGNYYIVDDQYRCRYLIGAAGTHCPVYRAFFMQINPRNKNFLITALETEIKTDYQDPNCHLWFFENRLPGYSWYVPKGNGYLNLGIGGYYNKLKRRNSDIKIQWNYFYQTLKKSGLLHAGRLSPRGYVYYLKSPQPVGQIDNAYIIGDSAGLATCDMGEGIGPAIESGIRAANSIIKGTYYPLRTISRYSIPAIVKSGSSTVGQFSTTRKVAGL